MTNLAVKEVAMRNKSAILLAAITLAAFASCADPLSGDLGLYYPEDHFLFRTIDNGTAMEITGYVGGRIDVRIPPYIRGLPVTVIGDFAFRGNEWDEDTEEWVSIKSITTVIIPYGVTQIGAFAFSNNQLASITIPSSVIFIDIGAFFHNQLANITIPGSVTHIAFFAFANNWLIGIGIGSDVTIYEAPPTWTFDGYDRFGDSFAPFYESQGRMAGTYTYSNGTWIFQPR